MAHLLLEYKKIGTPRPHLRYLVTPTQKFQTKARAFLNSGNWRAWPTDHKYHIFKDNLRSSTVRRGHRTFEESEKYRFFQSLNTPISATKFPNCVLFTNRFRWNFAETFLGSKQSNAATQFSKICPTSGFMGNFRFRLVFQISRYTINQSKLGIAQIEV